MIKGKGVMIVDAYDAQQRLAGEMLQELGATVYSVSSNHDFDPGVAAELCVILFFFDAERRSAWEVLNALSAESPHLLDRCVIVTKADFVTIDPQKVPASQILFEPVSMESLLTCVEGVAILSDLVTPCTEQPVIAA